jgi:hypothetical protein
MSLTADMSTKSATASNGNNYGARVGRVNIAAARRAIPAVRLGSPPFGDDAAGGAGAAAGGAGVGAVEIAGARVRPGIAKPEDVGGAGARANVKFGFRSSTDEHKSLYSPDRFYEFMQDLMTATDGSGDEIPIEMLEEQMNKDVMRDPMTINGLFPLVGETWTKDTLVAKLQSILGDGWERWKAVMYKPLCVAISQTIVAQGMEHFSINKLHNKYLIRQKFGRVQDPYILTIDPSSGAVEFIRSFHADITSIEAMEAADTMDDVITSTVSTNIYSVHVKFAPSASGDKPYTGSIVYSMDQTELFNNIVNYCDAILIRIMTLVAEKATKPKAELTKFFEGLADRIVSIERIRRGFPVQNLDLIRSVSILMPYFKESREAAHIYDISPRCDDYINYLMLITETIRFINSTTNPIMRQFTQLAQNAEGTFHIQEILYQISVYILLRVGFIPVLRIRSSPSISFYTANERYRMEQNAKRTGTSVFQPTARRVAGTSERLPKGLATLGRALGWLGGGRKTKIAKNRKRKNSTVKRRQDRR